MTGDSFQIENFLQNDISLFFVILSVTILGSLVKDIFTGKNSKKKVSLRMMYASAFIVSVLLYAWSETILKYFPGRKFLAVCVVLGLVSVEITKRLTTIEGIKKFIDDFIDFKQRKK